MQLHLEFDIAGKVDRAALEVNIELSETQLTMKNLFFSNDAELITFSVEFARK